MILNWICRGTVHIKDTGMIKFATLIINTCWPPIKSTPLRTEIFQLTYIIPISRHYSQAGRTQMFNTPSALEKLRGEIKTQPISNLSMFDIEISNL